MKLNFDGVTDPCSSGKDIIFQFKGFRVFGKVYFSLTVWMKGCSFSLFQLKFWKNENAMRKIQHQTTSELVPHT